MPEAKYLIVGASHAGLEAMDAIRREDTEGSIAVLTKDDRLPYSPTILPYVVSGRSQPEKVVLRDQASFDRQGVKFVAGAPVAGVKTAERSVVLADGTVWTYEKLLLATGARPTLPPVPGLDQVRYHVLRSMDDALGLRAALGKVKSAVVLGAGLVGMHAAENLLKAGAKVTVVEMRPQVLPGYFDTQAAKFIEDAFIAKGAAMLLGRSVARVAPQGEGCRVTLADGAEIDAELLVVAAGVVPETAFLAGSGITVERGVVVDGVMRTNVEGVWAAGDVAQADDFFGAGKVVGGILPAAVEQGRIAGMSMAGDQTCKRFPGNVPMNTYAFFGSHAISVGQAAASGDGLEEHKKVNGGYLRIVLKDNRLWGIAGINTAFDAGIMWQLILRKIDLGPVKAAFLANPKDVGRALMSKTWR